MGRGCGGEFMAGVVAGNECWWKCVLMLVVVVIRSRWGLWGVLVAGWMRWGRKLAAVVVS